MECYKVQSEFIDSLDFLSPPVKRFHNNRDVFVGPVYNSGSTDSNVFRGHSNKFGKSNEKIIFPQANNKTGAESSTSLILQKTTKRQILDRYSLVSYTSLHASNLNAIPPKKHRRNHESKSKPLIRVTVIPKSDQVQTAKLLKRRRRTPKRVQSTLSNQENSIQTKNVYVVVAGRRQDKIYEIKTTGSATFSSDQTDRHDKLSVAALTNVRQLIQSLNMDQTPTGDIKVRNSNERQIFTNGGNDPYRSDEFMTPHTSDFKTEKRSCNRSRLRIYGQLGLSDDDRYVLRYGALVNDKSVSDYVQLASDSSKKVTPVTKAVATRDDGILFKKDASVQASYEEMYELPRCAPCFPFGETQGTQVNFNVQVMTKKRRGHNNIRTTEQDTQCSCNNIKENKGTSKCIKESQSPLVIISVYPKPGLEDNCSKSPSNSPKGIVESKRNTSPTRQKRKESARVLVAKVDKNVDRRTDSKKDTKKDTIKRQNEDAKKINRSVARSRSPSPIKKINELNTSDKYFESRGLKSQTGKKNLEQNKTLNMIKKNILDKDKYKTESRSIQKYHILQHVNKKPMQNYQRTLNEIGINTEHARAKKLLVDNYTKTLSDHWNEKDVTDYKSNTPKVTAAKLNKSKITAAKLNNPKVATAKLDNSKVTPAKLNNSKLTATNLNNSNVAAVKSNNSKVRINIDGEHERYNLLFGQGKLTTDIKINKTIKPTSSSKCCGNLPNSLENLFVVPDKETTVHPMSVAVYKPVDDMPASERISGITIRDSLEISHRRGDKNYYNMKNTQTCFAAHCNDYIISETQYLAPIKHYIGDDCSICDPIQRDKEIRELLGVDKTKAYSSDDDRLNSCFYRTQCERNHIARINLVKLCPCLQTTNTDTEYSTCIPEGCPEQCCPKAPCNVTCLQPQLDREPKSPDWCQQDEIETTNTSDLKLSNYSPCPNVIAAEKQFQKQLQHQQQQLLQQQMLLQKQQQQQQLHLQQQQQQLRVQQEEYKTGCGGCCATNENEENCIDEPKTEENGCCCDPTRGNAESSAIYQQLILNRNIQVFLQVEQFSKQRPIVLSRKQYDKVKKTIQSTILCSRDKRKKLLGKCNASNVSVGEIRKKTNVELHHCCDQEVQTDIVPCNKNSCRKETTKRRKTSKIKYLSHKLRRNKLDTCCNKRTEDDSSNKECIPPPKHSKRNAEYSSATCCSSSSSEDDRRKHFEKYQRPGCNRHKENSGYCKSSGQHYKPRVERCKNPVASCRPTAYPPSGCGEQYYRAYGNCPKQNKFSCNTEHQTMTDEPKMCEPSGLVPQRNRADINLQRVVGEYARICGEPVNLNIEQHFNTTPPYKANVPYKPSEYRESNITNSGLYRQYDDEDKVYTGIERLPPTYNDQILGNVNDNLEQHPRADRGIENPLDINKEYSGYPKRVEHYNQIEQRRELKNYLKNGSQCEIPHRLDADLNLLKTTSQNNNSVQFEYRCRDGEQKSTIMLYNATNNENRGILGTNKTLSSMEIRYTSMAYMKQQHIDLSTTDLAVISESSLAHVQSFQTIFRGHRKSPTPNLGTSIYSLYSEEGLRSEKSTTFIMAPKEVKPVKRPFLRRLMSCLVMRSARASDLKMPTAPVQEIPSINSSVDSYHISTSLGAVEVSSSIYDTSASFYSNHTILPINSKIKRGFFSSVRGFLTNKKG